MLRRIVATTVAAALFAAATVGSAAASDLVVLESNVASLAPGSVVPATQSVSLGSGARLVMIAADGTTRSVTGPYSGAIGQAGSDAPGALERLTTSREDSNHVVGAIRAPSWDQ
ncbi:MAG: hypothetical protein AAF763_07710 [Pseudomonadota bacterium]